MVGYLIDVKNGKHGTVKINDKVSHLQQYYDLIGCECIDIAVRKVGETYYNVVLDDEGLLVDRPTISAIDHETRGMLAGNLLIFGINEGDMELTDLTDDDVRNIKGNVIAAIDFDTMKPYPVVFMEY